ncbi:MAG: ATP-binding protein [Fimbriimonadales bacterium]|nr:ATP-binding protein [Fimbriimonadales bacterium]
MYTRWITERVERMAQITPAVFLQGARQVGKTTLARQLVERGLYDAYYTLDDPAILESAQRDPVGFIRDLPVRAVIDEVQRAPELLLPLKMRIDSERKQVRFLLTGSASPLALPQVADALVGRMAVLTLHPLSQGELTGVRETWLTRAFEGDFRIQRLDATPDEVWRRVQRGGYPEAVAIEEATLRGEWLRAYVNTLLTRDVRLLSDIERVAELTRLIQLLASLSHQILNLSNLSRETGIAYTTLQRYMALLETLMVVVRTPPWYANLSKQLLKSPRVMLNDTGLALALLRKEAASLDEEPQLRGRMLETFVGMELLKQIEYSDKPARLYHLRSSKGEEIDFVLEDEQGRLLGVEVKSGATVGAGDFKRLEQFGALLGERWAGGVVLYLGETALPFGERQWAMPVASLWSQN